MGKKPPAETQEIEAESKEIEAEIIVKSAVTSVVDDREYSNHREQIAECGPSNERIDKVLASAKRTALERHGIHAWHPYYAGYSEAFVRSALSYLRCDSDTVVLDPWGGSGTTGTVASQEGISSICSDINPVMATFSAAKSTVVLNHQKDIRQFFEADNLRKLHVEEIRDDPLQNIFHTDTATVIRTITEAIPVAAHLNEIPKSKELNAAKALTCFKDISIVINPTHS